VFGNLSQNYEIQDGDSINVPPKKNNNVKIFGEVNRPITVAWDDGMDLVTALNVAGGPIPNRAKRTRILVVRPKVGNPDAYYMIQCDMVAYEKKHDYSQNIKIYPGDVVIVPNNGNINFDVFSSIANALFILDRFGIRIAQP